MKSKGLRILLSVILAFLVGTSAVGAAPPPPYLTYQGHLYDSTGLPVADGAYEFAFSLWSTGMAGTRLWGPETQTLTVRQGYFAATLGQQTPLPALSSTVYLEITVNGETLMPRQPLQSVAFALNADVAETAQDSGTLAGQGADYYRDWQYTLNVPAGFADGIDNDTIYTNADALAAVAAAGYLTQTGVFTDAQMLDGQPGSYYLSWHHLTGMPIDFADGVDNDTVYTDAQALTAVAGAGYLNVSDVITVMQIAGYVSQTQVATLIGAADIAWGQLSGVPAGFADGRDNDTTYTAGRGLSLSGTEFTVVSAPWSGLTGMPAGFTDGVDNDTVYTDAAARQAVAAAGYLTATQVISTVAAAGYTTADQVLTIITGTGTLTLTVSQAANAELLDGEDSSYYLDASHLNAGTLGPAYYSAAGDLAVEGYLDNNAPTDLMTQGQADGRYLNTGEASSVTGAMLADGATLSEITDDDGAGSGLDSDLLDGQSGAYYLAWGNQTGIPAGFADGADNDTTYTAGTGLNLSSTQFSADTTYLQRRVSSICAVGSSIRAIAADGTVTCEPDDDTNTTYTAGAGLTLVGTQFNASGTPYANVIIVAKSGGDYPQLSAAVTAASPTAANPTLIWIAPGHYTETAAISLKPYLTVQGAGRDVTVITSTYGTASGFTAGALQLAPYSTVQDLTFVSAATTVAATGLSAVNLASGPIRVTRVNLQVAGGNAAASSSRCGVYLDSANTTLTLTDVALVNTAAVQNANYGLYVWRNQAVTVERTTVAVTTGVGSAVRVRGAVQITQSTLQVSGSTALAALDMFSGNATVVQTTLSAPAGKAAVYFWDGATALLEYSHVSLVHFGTATNTLIARHSHLTQAISGTGGTRTCLAVTTDTAFYANTCP